MPEEALYGSVRLSQLWGKKVLKVHFMNPEVLKKDGWKYGDDPLSQSQILSWVKSWNDNAVSYPKISLSPATKQDADIRVTLTSCECSTDTLISGAVLEYFAGENPLRMSQISRKFDPLRSNYCVLVRIVCIY